MAEVSYQGSRALRVVEVSRGVAAASCGRLFADSGASVLKISLGIDNPAAEPNSDEGRLARAKRDYLDRGKEQITLSHPLDSTELRAVAGGCDVLIEDNWPACPELADELQSYDEDGSIVVSFSPFGRSGERSGWSGGELEVQASGGLTALNGAPDKPPLRIPGDPVQSVAGLHGFIGALAALWARPRTGAIGRRIDISLEDCAVADLEYALSLYSLNGVTKRRGVPSYPFGYPHDLFETADGYLVLSLGTRESMKMLGIALEESSVGEDERFRTEYSRALHCREFDSVVRPKLKQMLKMPTFLAMAELRMLAGPVLNGDEILAIPQLEARKFFRQVESADGHTYFEPGPVLRSESLERLEIWSAGQDDSRPTGALSGARATPHVTRASSPTPAQGGNDGRLLSDIRILDLTIAYAGPTATRILSELGADVIRVSSTQYPARGKEYPLWLDNVPGSDPWNRCSYYIERYLGKREITLDLGSASGRELFLGLVEHADVVVHNYSPRVLRHFGLAYETLKEVKPNLVMVSLSGYGSSGPWGDYGAYGTGIEALAGLCTLMGYPQGEPKRPGMTFSDCLSGITAAAGLLAGLMWRLNHDDGVHVDVSMLEATLAAFPEAMLSAGLKIPLSFPRGNQEGNEYPAGVYPCRGNDEWVAISVESDEAWRRLCEVEGLGLEGLGLESAAVRRRTASALDQRLGRATRPWDKFDLAFRLQSIGVRAAPVMSAKDILKDRHLWQRGILQMVDQPGCGRRPFARQFPAIISQADVSIPRPAPRLGQHNEEILGAFLSVTSAELDRLRREEVVGEVPVSSWDNVEKLNSELLHALGMTSRFDPEYRWLTNPLEPASRTENPHCK